MLLCSSANVTARYANTFCVYSPGSMTGVQRSTCTSTSVHFMLHASTQQLTPAPMSDLDTVCSVITQLELYQDAYVNTRGKVCTSIQTCYFEQSPDNSSGKLSARQTNGSIFPPVHLPVHQVERD